MIEFLGLDPNFPIIYMVPLFVFGPIFFLVLYNLGLKHLINPSPEVRRQVKLRQQEKKRLAAERQQKIKDSGLKMGAGQRTPAQLFVQGLAYALFALGIAYFSTAPAYVANPPGMAQLKLSFTHAGKYRQECRKRSREELAKLAANMRAPMSCGRERWPVIADLSLNGKKVFSGVASPAGLFRGGQSSFYQELAVPAGFHTINLGLWDSRGEAGPDDYDYTLQSRVELTAGEILVIGFDNETGRITLE